MIRISGPDALGVCGKVFFPKSGKDPADCPRRALFGEIRFPAVSSAPGETVDTGVAVYYKAPASYTGEDTVELCCHGGSLVTREVLRAVLAAGARQAEKGEFTRRACASGKMTLTEAESLGLLIDAGTEAQLKLSRAGMNGTLARECDRLRREITALLTDIYARIDFPEEDLGSIPEAETVARIRGLIESAETLLGTYSTGRAISDGIETVICGRTNTGKSTLFNRLTGSDDAIVTDTEGTTRDVLSATVSFGGVTLRLCDTAGIRKNTSGSVEDIGIERAIGRIRSAELVFFVIDASRAPGQDDLYLADFLRERGGSVIAVLNKTDLGEADPGALALFGRFEYGERVSAETGEGIDRLASRVSSIFTDGLLDIERDPVISTARQYEALSGVADSLREALESAGSGYAADVVSVCLEKAAGNLTELDGRGRGAVSEDVIEEIFSRFCVGK